ncbi:MAG: branched-chain amino acid ABC transporter permease [Anaerolineae bacterium]
MKPEWLTTKTAMILVGLAIALAMPALLGSNQYNMVLATTVLLFGVITTAWNIIGGMGGQLDLAACAYLGLGAFTAGTLLVRWDISPWFGMILGGLVAAGFAALVGYPLFRFGVTEVWYALSSAALVEVLRVAFLLWENVGGPTERYLPFYSWSLYHMRFGSYIPYYYIMLAMLLIALFVNYKIEKSKLGYYLLALGENEDAAEVLGVDTRACKLKALMIYAFLVGATGAVYTCLYGYIHPNFFSGLRSIEVAVLGIVGGMGIIYGPLVAAVILVSGREFLRASLGGKLESIYLVIYAAVLILMALFRPQGIAMLLQDAYKQIVSRTTRDRHVRADTSGL